MAPILELHALKAFYGQSEVVHGIDVAVEEGGMTVLLGANGAGKTTTLRAICGMVRSEGEITFAGKRLDRRATEDIAALGVAHVPEGRGTFVGLTVEENLRLGGYTRLRNAPVNLERMYGYFPILADRRRLQGGALSGGEQQMLTVCRTLMGDPDLIMVDEPTEGLAPQMVERIADLLRTIAERNISILLVEQKLTIAMRISHRVYVMGHGRMVFEGTPDALAADAAVRRAWLEV
jgi:branched-chain amino acid transport system ATP-binding protein